MKKKSLKTPADYPIFSFRTTIEQKDAIQRLLEAAEIRLNKSKLDNERRIRKNDIVTYILLKELPKLGKMLK